MKKRYIKPLLERRVSLLPGAHLMIASGVEGDNGIGWGGYDDEGDINPSAKTSVFEEWVTWKRDSIFKRYDIWEE